MVDIVENMILPEQIVHLFVNLMHLGHVG